MVSGGKRILPFRWCSLSALSARARRPDPVPGYRGIISNSRWRPVDWFPSLRSDFPQERTRPQLWRERGIAIVDHNSIRTGSRGSNLGVNDPRTLPLQEFQLGENRNGVGFLFGPRAVGLLGQSGKTLGERISFSSEKWGPKHEEQSEQFDSSERIAPIPKIYTIPDSSGSRQREEWR